MTRRAWIYVLGVLGAGAALGGLSAAGLSVPPGQWTTFAALTLLATLAQLFRVEAPNHTLYHATPIFLVAAILLLHPFLFVLVVAVALVAEWAKERLARSSNLRAWYLQPFNIAMLIIAGSGAHWLYTELDLRVALSPPLALPVAATGAGLVYLSLNKLLLGQALVLARRVSWRESGALDVENLVTEAILACLGIVVAMLWRVSPWLIAPALSPLVLMYRALMIPQLKQDAQTDTKTGLCNAQHFDALFTAELDRARRFNRPLALIMADLDHFKKLNDTYGHLAGDTVLGDIGRIIRETIREYDLAGRFGGEEFIIVLPEAGLAEAVALAERLRRAVEAAPLSVSTSDAPVHATMSVGVACFPLDAATVTDLTQAADVALYQAKFRGRNRVVCAADVPRVVARETTPAPASPAGPDSSASAPASTHGTAHGTAPRAATRHAHPAADAGEVGASGSATDTGASDAPGSGVGRPAGDDIPAVPAVPAVPAAPAAPVAGIPAPLYEAPSGATPPLGVTAATGTAGLTARPSAVLPVFVGAVIAAAVGVAGLGVAFGAPPSLLTLGLLTGLAVLFELLQVDVYGQNTTSVSVAVAFAAALTTGITGVTVIALAIAVAHYLRRRPALYKAAFNMAAHLLAGAAPVFTAWIMPIPPSLPHTLAVALPAAIGAVAYYALDTGLVAAAISLSTGARLIPTWRTQFQWLAGHYLSLCLMGLFLSLAGGMFGPAGILVFALPILMMRYAQQQYVGRTESSMRELERMNAELARANREIVAAGEAERARLERAALTDSLTGLGNHRAYQEAAQRETARALRHGEAVTLARLDIDEFKLVNDQYGHGHGDRVLAELAGVLRDGRAEDQAFRLGGDEFALILPHTAVADAMAVLERLRREMRRRPYGAGISVGLAGLAAPDGDLETLQEQADAALHEAKRRGRNAVVAFDEVKDSVSILSPAKVQALRRLLAEGRVGVVFQPIWDIERGELLAFEALTRPAPDYDFAGPQEAFDIAERLGHAHDLDAVCRRAILARAAELPPDALLFVNVCPQTLDHDLLAGASLVEAVTAVGLAPGRVVLEITEQSIARLDVVVREARRLRGLSFKLALDDVGAGNAGLEMLSQVAVDVVKIDRGVVIKALADRAARGVLAGIVALARETDSYVIAEGIEDAAMLDLVRRAGAHGTHTAGGVRGVQGYLLGRPSESIPAAPAIDRYVALLNAA